MLALCSCCSWMCRPFVCASECCCSEHQSRFCAAVSAVTCAGTCALECVQFWTPLSLTFLLLWLLYRPDRFHPYVDDAVLAALDLAHDHDNASSIVHYDLSVGLNFRNPHSRLSIKYLDVGATAFYNRTKLGSAVNSLPSFRQPPKNTTVWHPAFRGVAVLSGEVAAQLGRERAAGVVPVRVTVYLTLMYKVWPVKDVVFYKYDCWLWFSPPRKDAPALFHGDGKHCWRV
ncbi:unnamed protein product [Urochloa humidicola]